MNWYSKKTKKAQQELLFNTYEFNQDASNKVPPTYVDKNGKKYYQCAMCNKRIAEDDIIKWEIYPTQSYETFDPTIYMPKIKEYSQKISNVLKPILNDILNYIKENNININDDSQLEKHLKHITIDNPSKDILPKYQFFNDIIRTLHPLLKLTDTLTYYSIFTMRNFITDPDLLADSIILQLDSRKKPVFKKAPICIDCYDIYDSCMICDNIIIPMEEWPAEKKNLDNFETHMPNNSIMVYKGFDYLIDNYVCIQCIKNGKAGICEKCEFAYSIDSMEMTEQGLVCDNCLKHNTPLLDWAEDTIINNKIPIMKSNFLTNQQSKNLKPFIDNYIDKYGNKIIDDNEWGRIFHLANKRKLSQDSIDFLNFLKNSTYEPSLEIIQKTIDQNHQAQKYISETYPSLKNTKLFPFEVKINEPYDESYRGFTVVLKEDSSALSTMGNIKFPDVSKEDIENIIFKMLRGGHQNDAIAYARCNLSLEHDVLIVNNLQRDFDINNIDNDTTDKEYDIAKWLKNITKDWNIILLDIIKNLCKENNINGYLTSFDYQKERWSNLPIHKAKKTYEKVPSKMNFEKTYIDDELNYLSEDRQYDELTQLAKNMNWYKKAQLSNRLEQIINKWKNKGITLYIFEKDDIVILDSIIVPKEKRKQGIGSQIINELIRYANSVGKRIELTTGTKDSYQEID